MLPDSTTIRNSSQNIAKFADTGIDELVRQMEKLGAKKREWLPRLLAELLCSRFRENDMMQGGTVTWRL